MFTGITMTCFAASYAVSFAAEVTRLFFRAPVRLFVIVGFSAAGLLAHSLFLVNQARSEAANGLNVAPLSSWFDWCLLAAWLLAAVYLVLLVRRIDNAVGVFLLPLILVLIGVSWLLRDHPPFPRADAVGYWRWIHGIALLLGTVAVTFGFAAGLMYLAQSYRLKQKLPPRPGFKLPSLEWLQRCNQILMLVSTGFLVVGLVAGIVMNAGQRGGSVAWTGPVVLSSSVLCAWLLAASLFEAFYKPARQGRKVAYLTLASFIFLALALGFVLFGDHAAAKPVDPTKPPAVILAPTATSAEKTSAEKTSTETASAEETSTDKSLPANTSPDKPQAESSSPEGEGGR